MRFPRLTQMDIHSTEYNIHTHIYDIHFTLHHRVVGQVVKRSWAGRSIVLLFRKRGLCLWESESFFFFFSNISGEAVYVIGKFNEIMEEHDICSPVCVSDGHDRIMFIHLQEWG